MSNLVGSKCARPDAALVSPSEVHGLGCWCVTRGNGVYLKRRLPPPLLWPPQPLQPAGCGPSCPLEPLCTAGV
jgi:hypothetical protein